jgi:hypothetical protein
MRFFGKIRPQIMVALLLLGVIALVSTLSGIDFITLVMVTPMVFAFVVLGVIIVWKTTSNPSAVAPHLDLILVAFAVFSNPVSAALGAIMQRYADQKGNGGKDKNA